MLLALTLLGSFILLNPHLGPWSGSMSVLVVAGLLLMLPLAFSSVVSARESLANRTLIVGTNQMARKLVDEIAKRRAGRDRIVGVADDVQEAIEPPFRELLAGPLSRLGAIIEELRPNRIVVALTDRRGRLPMRDLLDARMRGVAIEDAVDVYERLTGKLAIESLTPSQLISSKDFRKTHLDLASGHVASIVASVVGLLLAAPLMALISMAIRLDSPGPVFFVHERVGRGGRRFKLIKFRTMHVACSPTSEWECDNRDRITRVGRWLRKYRLDELPQLINVIRGEMNLVGPRPHPVTNYELFRNNIPYYSLRAVIRPGLTGWAQVRQGYANSLEEETEKMRYDLYYIKHMSAWLDLRILLSTVQIVLWGRESTVAAERRGGGRAQHPAPFSRTASMTDAAPLVLSDRRPAAATPLSPTAARNATRLGDHLPPIAPASIQSRLHAEAADRMAHVPIAPTQQ